MFPMGEPHSTNWRKGIHLDMVGGRGTPDNKIYHVICLILQLVDQSSECIILYTVEAIRNGIGHGPVKGKTRFDHLLPDPILIAKTLSFKLQSAYSLYCTLLFIQDVTLTMKTVSMLHLTLKVQEDSDPAEEILMTEALSTQIPMLVMIMSLYTRKGNGTH